MLWNYAALRFRQELFPRQSVIELIKEKLPVSISLGLWMTLIGYGVSIPLGIRQGGEGWLAVRRLDFGVIIIGYAMPGFLFAILLIVLFAGGSFCRSFRCAG
jgi:microcin C transport system permease protein